METFCKDEDAKEKSLNLITHVHVDPAHESDANALIPAIKSTKERGLTPEGVLRMPFMAVMKTYRRPHSLV